MTNIKIVDVIHRGVGYMLEASSRAVGTTVHRSRGVACNPRGCGQRIPRGDYYLYLRGEGRLCCRCAINLGSLEAVEGDDEYGPDSAAETLERGPR